MDSNKNENNGTSEHEYDLTDSESNSVTNYEYTNTEKDSGMALSNLMVMLSSPKPSTVVQTEESAFTIFFELMFQLASPAGLMGNLASVVSVADRWRMHADGQTLPERWWVLLLNCFALAFGCAANVVLFLHMQLWISRTVSLFLTSAFYLLSTSFYMALLAICEYIYFEKGAGDVHRTAGYWHGVIASCLYFLATFFIVVHIAFFWGKKVDFEASRRQNMLMRLCIIYALWIGVGAAVFQAKTVMSIGYADAVYFCLVTCMTLGFGDFLPRNNLSRALSIPFLVGGVLWEGSVTYNVFQASLTKAATQSVGAAVRNQRNYERMKILERYEQNTGMTDYESFVKMKSILKTSKHNAIIGRYVFSAMWLPTFWLIGALVFKYTEHWTYFEAFYMCFVSLVTVGYGDLTPSSTGGRPFFVYWAFIALPTMAIAVSDVTSFSQSAQENTPSFVKKFERYFNNEKHDQRVNEVYRSRIYQSVDSIPAGEVWEHLLQIIEQDDRDEFGYETWHKVVSALIKRDELPPDFWLSDSSPLCTPALEERKFLLFAASHLLYNGLQT